MLVEQVDAIGFQPPQRPFDRLPDVLGMAVQAQPLMRLGVELEAELRRDHHLITHWSEPVPDELLVDVRAVYLGGVEQRHPAVDGGT